MQQTDNLGGDIFGFIALVVATDKDDSPCGLETLVVIKRQKRRRVAVLPLWLHDAFGLRNVTDVDMTLREACRVRKPGVFSSAQHHS
jgi:hypothetical protein